MTSLPYWDSDVDMQIAPWFPLGVDYKPVSINLFHSGLLSKIAALALGLNSEFFCLASFKSGYVGTLLRDNMFIPGRLRRIELGFTMLFGYSSAMEEAILSLLEDHEDIEGGVSFCTLRDRNIIRECFKAIILVSGNPLFGEDEFLDKLGEALEKHAPPREDTAFFAETFGYRRFFIPYETDDPVRLEISRLLYEMEFEETRRWVGPSPEVSFPPFFTIELASG
ncbi:MAG: hypothetical protein ACOX5A_01190 [Aminivibrio sp.]|jgi:hypothetical protein|nr:chlorite dismutase family protein [Synergistaceae bacterium]